MSSGIEKSKFDRVQEAATDCYAAYHRGVLQPAEESVEETLAHLIRALAVIQDAGLQTKFNERF